MRAYVSARLEDLRLIAANVQLTTAQWKENKDEIDAAKLECERVMAVIVEGKTYAMGKPVDTEMRGGTKKFLSFIAAGATSPKLLLRAA